MYLSFYHIVSFADDNAIDFHAGQSGDHADVQIAVDLDPSAVDNFSRWTKLAPFQNVPEHTTQVFSWFGYCEFTPSDGAKSTNPAAYGETMCFPDQVWSHSGNVLGANTFAFFNAQGPGILGAVGDGIWVQTKFNLRAYSSDSGSRSAGSARAGTSVSDGTPTWSLPEEVFRSTSRPATTDGGSTRSS